MKLRELLALITINITGGKLPTHKQLLDSNIPIILQMNIGNAELIVYKNGLVCYSDVISEKIHYTVFSIDKLELKYEFTNKYTPSLKLSDYPELKEYDAVEILCMCGKDRLDYNTYNRERQHGSTSLTDEGLPYEIKVRPIKKLTHNEPDFTDMVINKLEPVENDKKYLQLKEAMEHLTEKQLEVIQLYFFENLTQHAIANKLGIGRTTVEDRLNSALKKLRKYIKE